MWKKKAFIDEIKSKLSRIAAQKASDSPLEPHVSRTYGEEKECHDALLWLSGKHANRDFKIESRQRDGQWFHSLMYGSGGYSAANPLAVIFEGRLKL